MTQIAVMVIIETDDPGLDPAGFDVSTAAGVARMRKAVIDNLPKLTRVVAVLPEPTARMMMQAFDEVASQVGKSSLRPPKDYIPPGRD